MLSIIDWALDDGWGEVFQGRLKVEEADSILYRRILNGTVF